ncbi:MAG: YggT family protein [Parachlamydiaceae bacterium]
MLAEVISLLFQIYMIMIFIRILGSWVPEFQTTKPMLFVAYYTDPYLNLFRKVIPPIGFIDISPIFAFIALQIIRSFLLGLL